MAQSQSHPPVIGFFDNIAEAQQAVQLLLADGFAREALKLSTQTESVEEKNSTGHFLFSLFGRAGAAESCQEEPDTAVENGAFVTVYAQSASESTRATNLLNQAGARKVES